MTLKKIFCSFTATMAMLLFLVGCADGLLGPKAKTVKKIKKTKKLKVAAFEGGYGKSYWEAITKLFEKDYPDTQVELVISPKIVDIIRPRLMAGDPPDYIFAGDLDKPLLTDNALLPLNDVFDSESLERDGMKLRDKILPDVLEYCTSASDGNIYYAPVNMSVVGIFYNSELFERNNWNIPVTWKDFFLFSKKAKKMERNLFTYPGIYPVYNEFLLSAMFASVIGPDGVKAITSYEENAWDNPRIKEVLEVYAKIAREGLLLKGTIALNHTQAQKAFLEGKAMFIPGGMWMGQEMGSVKREPGFKYGFMPVPKLKEDDQSYVRINFDRHYIPKSASNIESAKEFMKYQYKKENIILKAKLSSAVMPVVGGIELAKPFLAEGMYDCFSVFEKYGAQSLYFDWALDTNDKAEVPEVLVNSINDLMVGDIDVNQWLERLKESNIITRDRMTGQ